MIYTYKNTTGWSVALHGDYGRKYPIAPNKSIKLTFKVDRIPFGVTVREQKQRQHRKKSNDIEPVDDVEISKDEVQQKKEDDKK